MTTDATHQHPRFNSGEFYPVLQGGANRFYIFRWTKSNPMVMILGAGINWYAFLKLFCSGGLPHGTADYSDC